MDYGSEYYIRIPIEVYGKDKLLQVLDSVRGLNDAYKRLNADQKVFVKELREEINAAQDFDKALKSMITGASGASDAHRMMAMGIRALLSDMRVAEQQADRLSQAFGRVGGRIFGAELLGRMGGIPGGGFIGSQLMYSLGGTMSNTALAGVGVGAVGLLAGYGAYRTADTVSTYAQQQSNLAKQYGATPQDMQMIGRVSDVSDTQITAVLGSLRSMNKLLGEGGEESRKVKQALSDLGLTAAVAFESPMEQLTDVLGALRKVADESERERMAVRLLGEAGRSLLPLVDTFQSIADAVRRSGVIIDQDGIRRLVQFRQESKELELVWDSLKNKLAQGIVAKISWLMGGNNESGVTEGLKTAGEGAIAGALAGSLIGPWGTAGGAIVGAIAGGIGGTYWESHYGEAPLPASPMPNIPSATAGMQSDRLAKLNALKPIGRSRIEQLQSELKDIDTQIGTAREQYLSGSGRVGLKLGGDPALVSGLESKIRNTQDTITYAEDHPEQFSKGMVDKAKTQLGGYLQQLSKIQRLESYYMPGTETSLSHISDLERQRLAKENQIKYTREYEAQVHAFGELLPHGEMTQDAIVDEGRGLNKRFTLLKGYEPFQQRMSGVRSAQSEYLLGRSVELKDAAYYNMMKQFRKEEVTNEADLARFYAGELKGVTTDRRADMEIARGSTTEGERKSRIGSAVRGGYSRYGMTPRTIASTDLRTSLANIGGELGARRTGLSGEIDAMQAASTAYGNIPTDEAARQKEMVDAQISQHWSEIKSAESDAMTKAVEAINKFNSSVDEAAKAMRSEFAGGFANIIMGAQHGGKGAMGAIRGFFEGQEGTILRNVGERVWDHGVGGAAGKVGSHLPDWLSKGTIFGQNNQPIKLNTDAIDRSTNATTRLADILDKLTSGTPGSGGGTPTGTTGTGGAGGGTPVGVSSSSGGAAGTAEEVAGLATAAAALSGVTTGSTSAKLAGTASSLSKLSSVLKGTQYSGNFSKIMSGTLSTGQEIGAIGGTVALGIGAYEGISTMAKGGAKNVAGGLAVALGSIAPMTGPAAPFVGAAAALAGLVSTFMPDGKVVRGQEMSKRSFEQQYMAPEAIHMMGSGGGGYSDYDAYGGVRSSHFSPYPISSNSYLDVPRRTVVPGHELSPFGGYQNVTGAMTPSVIHYHTWNVAAMDSKGFIDNSHKILDAVNHGLNENFHPAIRTIAKQLGVA